MIQLPTDFREFLKSLSEHSVRYLLVGGYAVTFYGYPRSTGALDLWIDREPVNTQRLTESIRAFGITDPSLRAELFLEARTIVRMRVPPLRIEILTSVSGLEFDRCFEHRTVERWEEVPVYVISLADLRTNKRAAGRPKDLEDIDRLPED